MLELAQDGPKRASRNYIVGFTRCAAALFGPILGYLGPFLALLGAPKEGILNLGFARAYSGMRRERKIAQTSNDCRKINVFGRFLEANNLHQSSNAVFWRSPCGREGLKTAVWMSCWLQKGLAGAASGPSWPKLVPG